MKTAVVTGASYGIGESIAEVLLKKGWRVYGVSRSQPKFTDDTFVWLKCDLSDSTQISECLRAVTDSSIEALVSNAGVAQTENASLVTKDLYEHTFSVNVLAPMLVVNSLKEKIRKASIISVSSLSDRIPEADFALYCSSKAAITSYFGSLAAELTEARVYSLLPDYVDTPMQHRGNDNNKDFDWSACIDVKDIANLAANLINNELEVESGANIIIVTEKLKDDLKSVEKLYGFNADTKNLTRL